VPGTAPAAASPAATEPGSPDQAATRWRTLGREGGAGVTTVRRLHLADACDGPGPATPRRQRAGVEQARAFVDGLDAAAAGVGDLREARALAGWLAGHMRVLLDVLDAAIPYAAMPDLDLISWPDPPGAPRGRRAAGDGDGPGRAGQLRLQALARLAVEQARVFAGDLAAPGAGVTGMSQAVFLLGRGSEHARRLLDVIDLAVTDASPSRVAAPAVQRQDPARPRPRRRP
jgi:hypothetical protein